MLSDFFFYFLMIFTSLLLWLLIITSVFGVFSPFNIILLNFSPVMLKVKSECDSLFRQYEKCQKSHPDNAQRCSGRFNAFLDCVEMVASTHSWHNTPSLFHNYFSSDQVQTSPSFSSEYIYSSIDIYLIHIYMTYIKYYIVF